ncbi:MAG: F0F1 ATP synthase subunit A [Patescibacteria group bacterium]
MAAEAAIHIALAPYVLGHIGSFPITSTLLTSWLVVAVLVVFAVVFSRSIKLVPGKGQVAVETLVSFVYEYIKETLDGSERMARRYFPLILTLFVFIFTANIVGLLPFIGAVGIHTAGGAHGGLLPLFYPVNTDLNVTLALAIIAFVAIEFAGITALGVLKYGSKFVNLHSVLGFAVGIIELVSEVARLVTFSFRLFGNIFAGKVLILLALAFMPYFLPVPLLVYEVLVGVIQAAIFSLLTLFFIKIAVAEPQH